MVGRVLFVCLVCLLLYSDGSLLFYCLVVSCVFTDVMHGPIVIGQ